MLRVNEGVALLDRSSPDMLREQPGVRRGSVRNRRERSLNQGVRGFIQDCVRSLGGTGKHVDRVAHHLDGSRCALASGHPRPVGRQCLKRSLLNAQHRERVLRKVGATTFPP